MSGNWFTFSHWRALSLSSRTGEHESFAFVKVAELSATPDCGLLVYVALPCVRLVYVAATVGVVYS